jgi:thioredoxin reductase (NADPH)
MTVIEPTPQPQQGDIIHTDAVIIGAGPVGLFAVFELGLLNLKAHLIDNLDKIGGQCAELYPEKPIYDIPAFPQITGQELTDNLLEQIKPFDPQFHLNQQAAEVKRLENGNWFVRTTADTTFETPNVIIAAGAGSFVPRRPPLKGLDAFENKSVYYAVRNRAEFVGKRLVIAGGGDSALDWTLNLLPDVEHLTLVHRRDDFRAHPDSVSKMREAVAAGKMDLKIGQIKDVVGEDGQVEKLIFQSSKKEMEEISANRFLAFYGLKTELGPIAQWGLGLESNRVFLPLVIFAGIQAS